jgi:hypothetical protein
MKDAATGDYIDGDSPARTLPMITFDSGFSVEAKLPRFLEQDVKNEPMIFSGDYEFSMTHGGPITRAFLSRLPNRYCLIDSRTHMLMPGWYPCIPGWHLDDVPRTRPDGQPDHLHPAYKAYNIMAIVGDASVTEFITGQLALEDIGFYEGAVYGKWNAEINRRLAEPGCTIALTKVPESTMVTMPFGSFHRGSPATKNGWRFFIRANFNTARKASNEIRNQVQVYLPVPEAGW